MAENQNKTLFSLAYPGLKPACCCKLSLKKGADCAMRYIYIEDVFKCW